MGPTLAKAIGDLSLRMRVLRARQESQSKPGSLSERETIILDFLREKGKMRISEIDAGLPEVGISTTSTTITKLWRNKYVTKSINPKNQREVFVELTEKGAHTIATYNKHKEERFKVLFEAMDVRDEEKEVFLRVLNRAIKYIDERLINGNNRQQGVP
jgi:DNA-binding MarR family transcriptional regulator